MRKIWFKHYTPLLRKGEYHEFFFHITLLGIIIARRISLSNLVVVKRGLHLRNHISQICTVHRDVWQFSTPWQVNICMLIRLREFCRVKKMRRKELGIDRGWKTHSRGVTKGDARQSERVSVIVAER